jgi:hypothetical protein
MNGAPVSQPVRTLEHCLCLWPTRSGYNPALRLVRAPAAALLCTALPSHLHRGNHQPRRRHGHRQYPLCPSASAHTSPSPHLTTSPPHLNPSPPHVGSACRRRRPSWLWPHPPHMAADGRLKISCRDGCLLNSRPSPFGLRPAACQKHRRPPPATPLSQVHAASASHIQ